MTKRNALFAFAIMLFSISFAQGKHLEKKDNLLFLLRQQEHINQAIKTLDQLYAGSSAVKPGNVVIIVCGEAVTSLTNKDAEQWVSQISRYQHVSLMACGLSLEKFKKTEADLLPGVKYTPNGFIKAFELQKQGYLSIEL